MDVRRQKRERDSDLSSSPLQDTAMFAGENDSSKKAKTDGSAPSRVVHIRNIVTGVSETEVVQLCMPFGKVTNLLMMKQKNQAFVEFEQDSAAQTMLNYFSRSAQPMLGGRPVFVQYSQHKELKTDAAHAIANEKAQAALQACQNGSAGIMDGSNGDGFAGAGAVTAPTGQEAVLHVTIENMVYPVTLETLAIIFKKYGPVQKILTFTKNNKFQALIQYPNSRCSEDARFALHGQNVYNGCCNLRVESSKVTSVNVKFNNERAWDFTNPNLPAGDVNMRGNSGGGGGGSGGGGGGMGGGGMLGGYSPPNAGGGMMGGGHGPGMGMGNGHGMGGGMGGGMGMGNNPMMGGQGQFGAGGGGGGGGGVLLVSNLDEDSVNVDYLFTLFGVYGDVIRVKILFNKKDTALIQMSDAWMAEIARQHLDKLVVWGKPMNVRISKHSNVSMPRDDPAGQSGLTKDYTNSPLHRYKKAGSKNCSNIFKPGPTLHLSNIGEGVSQDDLVATFREYGTVHQFKFFNETQKMALLSMDSTEEAVIALIGMHNRQFGKQHLRVSFSKSQLDRN